MNTFLKLPIILSALLIFSSTSFAVSYKELGYDSQATMMKEFKQVIDASNLFRGTILKLDCSFLKASCEAHVKVDERYKGDIENLGKTLKYSKIPKNVINASQLKVGSALIFSADQVDENQNATFKTGNEIPFSFSKQLLSLGDRFVYSLIIGYGDLSNKYQSELYYSDTIVLAATTWFECKALDKENHSCDFKFKVEKVLKGEKSLVGKELHSRESENFKDKLKVGEKSVFLLEEVDANNNAKQMTIGDLVNNSSEYLVEKLEAIELLVNKQKDPKYTPTTKLLSFMRINAVEAWQVYSAPLILEVEVLKIRNVKVKEELSTANGYDIDLKITEVLKGNVDAKIEGKKIKHFFSYRGKISKPHPIDLQAIKGSKCLLVFSPIEQSRSFKDFTQNDYIFYHGINSSPQTIRRYLKFVEKNPRFAPQKIVGGGFEL